MGGFISLIDQNFPLAGSKWSTQQIPDLDGQVIIVTGANSGLGKSTVKHLLLHNAKVYIAARSPDRSREAIEDLKKETGREALFLPLDLADLQSVKDCVEMFLKLETRLDILYNNAGVAWTPMDQLSVQGYDLQFSANVLGHFLLTKLLLPLLITAAKVRPDGQARVISVSSYAHTMFPDVDFNTLKDSPARSRLEPRLLYGQSKFAQILFSQELAKQYSEQGIVSISLHPGSINTTVVKHMGPVLQYLYGLIFRAGVDQGALTQLRAGTDPEASKWNGGYMKPWGRVGEAHENAKNVQLQRQLWEYMEEQVAPYL